MNYLWDFNADIEARDKIIFGSYNPAVYGPHGGITRRFAEMELKTLKTLCELNYLSLNECQNCSPSIGEMMKFMEEHDGFTAHGYTVSDKRDDYRITLEGVEKKNNISESDIEDFEELFGDADDLVIRENYLYCWYD